MKKHRWLFILFVLALAFGAAGCSAEKTDEGNFESEEQKDSEILTDENDYDDTALYQSFIDTVLAPYQEYMSGTEYIDLDENGIHELIVYNWGAGANWGIDIYTIENGEVCSFSKEIEGIARYGYQAEKLAPSSVNAVEWGFCGVPTDINSDKWITFKPCTTEIKGHLLYSSNASEVHQTDEYYLFTSDADGYLCAEKLAVFTAEAIERDSKLGWNYSVDGNALSEKKFSMEVITFRKLVEKIYGIAYSDDNTVPLMRVSEETTLSEDAGISIDPSLTAILDQSADELRSTYRISLDHLEHGGWPVYSLEELPGVFTVYHHNDRNEEIQDTRRADEILITEPYSGQVCGFALGDQISESSSDIDWYTAGSSVINGTVHIDGRVDGYVLRLVMIIAPEDSDKIPDETIATPEDWAAWRAEFVKAPFGEIVSMRIRVLHPLIEDIIFHPDRGGSPVDALEPFWEDDLYVYSFPNPRSEGVYVHYKDGTEKNIVDALSDGSAVIGDLDLFGVKYYRDEKEHSHSTVVYSDTVPDNQLPDDIESEENVLVMKQYRWDKWGFDTKIIRGSSAVMLTDMLLACIPTGESAQELSDSLLLDENEWDQPCEPGTMWIETSGNTYRLSPGFKTLASVDGHLGAGEVLTMDEQCKKEINRAWRYWPKDCWEGRYENGILTMEQKYKASSNISAVIQDIEIKQDSDEENTILIEFVSLKDMELKAELDCYHSDDNLGVGDRVTLELKAGEAQTVELSFGGFWNKSYFVSIEADHTWMEITVVP